VKEEKKVKKVVKKQPKKMEVSVIRQFNQEVPYELHFVLADGRRLKNIFELIDVLENMSDEVFCAHVTGEKNDFANWINEVIKEDSLAEKIRKLDSRLETQNALLKHLLLKLQ
jgi:hypothetical protein